ncbi:MAG: YajQ family cyclic di-GMP-binding protein [Gammaproteobacteria bacterium]|nr:YajQ family cyclic di-GMP-binding protein [Gammaproteobacteria bacterium]MCH9744802.1 YajQ family cyclic di-GMP-binding protein [Gammaproteobacteria bacterium]
MPSFDIVCELDHHELSNAVDQANREVTTRFDFKGSGAKYELDKATIKMKAEADFQLKQMLEILRGKLTKRGIDLAHLKVEDPVIQHKSAEQLITLREGISGDIAKKVVKMIKDNKFKVQASIQGDQVRVAGKKRDELQSVIAFMREQSVELPLDYQNFRD